MGTGDDAKRLCLLSERMCEAIECVKTSVSVELCVSQGQQRVQNAKLSCTHH